MDYASALHRLMGLADLERMTDQATSRPRYDLKGMGTLLYRLGDPHREVPTVHITGTKGKGSVAAMVTSILAQAGYAVGLYTSPHLHAIRERIRLGRDPLSEEQFADLVEQIWPVVEGMSQGEDGSRVTTFEALTAMAFLCFAQTRRDVQVLEVGLGGTLDATNVVDSPQVCILTSISLDHTNILGDTVEKIARDKAGIIKRGAQVVTAPQLPEAIAVLEEVCREKETPLVKVGEEYRWEPGSWNLDGQAFRAEGPSGTRELWMPLLGAHQLENACCALAAVEAMAGRGMKVGEEAIAEGLRKVQWPGRLEVLHRSPLVMVDGAHNPYSMQRLVEAVQYHFRAKRCILIMGCTRGHSLEGMVEAAMALEPAQVLATRSRHPRAVAPAEIARLASRAGVLVQELDSVAEGVERAQALAGREDLVLATGSLFTVAEVREHLKNIPPELYPELEGPTLRRG